MWNFYDEYIQKIVVKCFWNEITYDVESSKLSLCFLSHLVELLTWHAGSVRDRWSAVLNSGSGCHCCKLVFKKKQFLMFPTMQECLQWFMLSQQLAVALYIYRM